MMIVRTKYFTHADMRRDMPEGRVAGSGEAAGRVAETAIIITWSAFSSLSLSLSSLRYSSLCSGTVSWKRQKSMWIPPPPFRWTHGANDASHSMSPYA